MSRSRLLLPRATVVTWHRAPLCLILVVQVVLVLAGMWREAGVWLGWLPAVAGVWARSAVTALPVGAAYAAYVAAAGAGGGLGDLAVVAARHPLLRLLAVVREAAWASLVPALAVLTGAGVLARYYGAPVPERGDALWCLVLVLSMSSAWLAFAVVGAFLGHRTRLVYAVPAALALPYLVHWGSLALSGPEDLAPVLTVTDSLQWTAYRTEGGSLLLRTTLWVLIAVAAAGVLLRYRRTVVVAAAVGLVAALLGSAHGATSVPVTGALTAACDESGRVPVCLPRYAAAGLGRYARETTVLLAPLPDSALPAALTGVSAAESPGVPAQALYVPPVSGVNSNTVLVDRGAMAENLGLALFDMQCEPTSPAGQMVVMTYMWWWESAGLSDQSSRTHDLLASALTPESRSLLTELVRDPGTSHWLGEHWQQLRECRLTKEDMR